MPPIFETQVQPTNAVPAELFVRTVSAAAAGGLVVGVVLGAVITGAIACFLF